MRRCQKMSDVRRCEKMSDVRRCEKMSDVRGCEKSDVRRCEKMSDVRRCEKMSDVRGCEKISHVRRSFICRSIYTSFFLKNPSLRRSREKMANPCKSHWHSESNSYIASINFCLSNLNTSLAVSGR